MEQKFQRLENWVIYDVKPLRIRVVLSEASLGMSAFRSKSFEDIWDVVVAPNQTLRFEWTIDPSASGSDPGPSNYAIDIPSPGDESGLYSDPDGMGGWTGWANRSRMHAAVSFPPTGTEQVHDFYLKARDSSYSEDSETHAHVRIHVVDFSFDRRFLLVDDQRRLPLDHDNHRLEDDASDAWRQRMFSCLDDYLPTGESATTFNIFDPGEPGGTASLPPDFLQLLSRYQTVIWDCASTSTECGLAQAARSELSSYVGAGGNLLLLTYNGPATGVVGSEAGSGMVCNAGDHTDPGPDEDNNLWSIHGFLWRHLHLRGCLTKTPGYPGEPSTYFSRRDRSMIGARAEIGVYPDLQLDFDRFATSGATGDGPQGDIHFECLGTEDVDEDLRQWYEFEDGLEVLYRARAWNSSSPTQNRPVAWRTHTTDEDAGADHLLWVPSVLLPGADGPRCDELVDPLAGDGDRLTLAEAEGPTSGPISFPSCPRTTRPHRDRPMSRMHRFARKKG